MADEDALSEWTEVNITPASWEQRERLLLDVVDPLVHDTLDGRMAAWHYFWEPALRLRIRWKQPTQDDLRELTSFLDAAKTVGKLTAWISGNHGKPGETYTGEAPGYGPEVWDETYRDWTSASELALSIVKHDAAKDLSEPRPFHWQRRVHLFSNELGLGFFEEGCWSLDQANGYLDLARKADDPRARDPEISALIDEILSKSKQFSSAVQRWIHDMQAGR
jgi:hypothetical protein